jgi:hypothetical protein
MNFSMTLALLSCMVLLGGCANPRALVAGQSTETDVRSRMGNSTDTHVDRNGDRIWNYATGPQGHETYQVRFGADGKVTAVTQVLTEEQLERVVPGKTTKDEVAMMFGPRFEEVVYVPGLTWTWRYNKGGIQPGWLVVAFNPDGTVLYRIALLEPSGGGRDD